MITASEVMDLTSREFPGWELPAHAEPLEKGGSGRSYFRVVSGSRKMVFARYTDERRENARFVEIARFLATSGVSVPAILRHLPAEGCLWMEDAGPVDLWAFREEPWEVRLPLYRSALEELAKLHTCATESFADAPLELEPGFDEALYRWEQGYFFEHCLGGFFQTGDKRLAELASLPALGEIPGRLAGCERVLVHRDFQSQNVIIRDGTAVMIDFQGLRPGVDAYDLASIVFDPYVTLSPAERDELVSIYRSARDAAGRPLVPGFEEVFHLCALQRLMQALGAYGFLGLKKNKPAFLQHIPAAMRLLDFVVARIPGLAPLSEEIQQHL